MALTKLKIPKTIEPVLPSDPKFTNPVQHAQYNLARMGVKGILWLIFGLTFMFFLLLILNIQKAELFKEVLMAFITFASGAIGAVFGYYFRSHEEEK